MGFEITGTTTTKYQWDIISVILTVGAVSSLMMLFVLTGSNIVAGGAEIYLVTFSVATALIIIIRGKNAFKLQPALAPGILTRLLAPVGGFLGIVMVQTIVFTPPSLDFYSTLVPRIFFTSGGIIEEWVFTFGFQAWILDILRANVKLAILVSTVVKSAIYFTAYHLRVYGTTGTVLFSIGGVDVNTVLVSVFLSGIVLGLLYGVNRKLWANQLAHGAINWVSTP